MSVDVRCGYEDRHETDLGQVAMEETVTLMLKTVDEAGAPVPVTLPRQVGNVRLGETLGEGAGGVVLAGFDDALQRRVAVKVLHRRDDNADRAATAELVEGIRSAAAVKHPCLVAVHSVEQRAGVGIIVMEFVDGVALRAVLRQHAPLEVPVALYVMEQLADAVAALHAAGVVHRDLKPANVLFDRTGGAFVCDFGLACRVPEASYGAASEQIAGSPLYMAPETFEGQFGPQGDVYALGVMLFEALAGGAPFHASSMSEMHARHRDDPPPLERLEEAGIAAEVIDVVRRALHKQRFLRYKSAEHLRRALAQVRATAPGDAVLRNQVASLVAAIGSDVTRGAASTPAAQTTFDLLRQRAAAKRDRRDARE